MIKERVRSQRILKQYGKALYHSHISSVDNYLGDIDISNEVFHISSGVRGYYHRFLRRTVLVILILIFTFALTITICSALEIELSNITFIQKKGYAVLQNHNKNGGCVYYAPTYTAKGYRHYDTSKDKQMGITYTYVNKKNQNYTIVIDSSKGGKTSITTENTIKSTGHVGESEVVYYENKNDGSILVLLQKRNTLIYIMGYLNRAEIDKIIRGLKAAPWEQIS